MKRAVAAPAEDDVVLQLGDLSVHAPPLPALKNSVFHPERGQRTDRVGERSDSHEDETNGENAPGGVERLGLAIANGPQRNVRHVEGAEKPPALDDHIACDADDM